MDKEKKARLREKGYVPLEEFMPDNLFETVQFDGDEEEVSCAAESEAGCFEHKLKQVRAYLEASDRFHQPGGDGHFIMMYCLQNYLDYKFIKQNSQFRFDVSEYPGYLDFEEETDSSKYKKVKVKHKESADRNYWASRADIYFLLNEVGQHSVAARRCMSYVNSNRLHLTAVLIKMIEHAVEIMENDASSKRRQYARLLRVTYMEQQYSECDVFELYEILGCSKRQYYRMRSSAVSLLSEILFGFFAGQSGLAELFLKDGDICFPEFFREMR